MLKTLRKITFFTYKNLSFIIFSFFLLLYIFSGMEVSYFAKDVFSNLADVVFGADIGRCLGDFTSISYSHWRTYVHPLQIIIIQPVCALIYALFKDSMMASIIFIAFLSSLTAVLLQKTIFNFTNSKPLSLIMTLIFGFSFSSLVFSSIPETYVISTFFNALLLNYVSILIKNGVKDLTFEHIFTLSLISIFSFGIIPVNFINSILIILPLFLKIYGKNLKKGVLNFFLYLLISLTICFFLYLIQHCAWKTPFLQTFEALPVFDRLPSGDISLSTISIKEIFNILYQNFIASFISSPIYIQGFDKIYQFVFEKGVFLPCALPIFALYGFSLIMFILNFKQTFKKTNVFIFPLALIVLIQAVVIQIYGLNTFVKPYETFLYSENYIYYLILLISLLINLCPLRPLKYVFFGIVFFEVPINFYFLYKIREYVYNFISSDAKPASLPLHSFLIFAIILLLISNLKKILNPEIFSAKAEVKYFNIIFAFLVYILIFALIVSINYWRALEEGF